jgi:predicted GNAT family N-acyltransferase
MDSRNSPQIKSALPFTVSIVDWAECGGALSQVRFEVFVREQGVPPEIELDVNDANPTYCVHAAALDDEHQTIATGRLLLDSKLARVGGIGHIGRIGRMAVVKRWRGNGVGVALLECLTNEAKRRGYGEVMLYAQTHATAFYFKRGFLSHGGEFVEAGMPHQEMRRKL